MSATRSASSDTSALDIPTPYRCAPARQVTSATLLAKRLVGRVDARAELKTRQARQDLAAVQGAALQTSISWPSNRNEAFCVRTLTSARGSSCGSCAPPGGVFVTGIGSAPES